MLAPSPNCSPQEAGKFVAVSAGDGLEATMAAHGSGAVAHSGKMGGVVLNIDIGGGTSKFAICNNGKVQEVSAIDIGARLLAFDQDGAVVRIEEAGRKHAAWAGFSLTLGEKIPEDKFAQNGFWHGRQVVCHVEAGIRSLKISKVSCVCRRLAIKARSIA